MSLCTALIYLEQSIMNLMTPGAEAIHAVVIILDSFSLSGSILNSPPNMPTSPSLRLLVDKDQKIDTMITNSSIPLSIEEAINDF